MSNISGDHGEKLFLALDGGTVSDTLPSVTYKAVLMVDGTVYDSVSAELTNTTYQASVLNGSFEAPDLTNYYFQEFVPEGTAGLFWKTTALNTEGDQFKYPDGKTGQNDGERYIEIIDTEYLFLERNQIIHTGTMYVLLSIALNASRRQMIAPVPLGTEALSSNLKAPVICVGGLMLFLISMGCS